MRWDLERRRQRESGVFESTSHGRQHAHFTTGGDGDDSREQRIDLLQLELLAATDPSERRVKWNALRDEINGRSPTQIRRMELASGLVR